ncbi:MAG: hypothetical protein AAGF47_00700 [Planctomycetota bacterium]
MSSAGPTPRRAVLMLGMTLMVWSITLRCVTMNEPLPGWDIDPLVQVSAITGLGPGGRAVLDLVLILGASLAILTSRHRPGWPAVLSLVGGLAVLGRTLWLGAGNALEASTALSWTAAWSSFAAASTLAREPAARRLFVAACVGVVGMLLAKSALQVLVEHPITVRQFEADSASALAARGIEPGSPSAVQFERRLRQPDAFGWFGLSNVLAAVLAAAASLLMAAAWHTRRGLSWTWRTAAAVAVAALGLGLLATGSKSGPAAVALVLVWLLGTSLLPRSLRWLFSAGVLLVPTVAVAARGLLGVPEGELSLLFRWFYLVGGGKVIAEQPLTGTDIAGFRDAYVLAKPAGATESVTSTHHAAVDLLAMLGVFGWLWVAALLGSAAALCRRASEPLGAAIARMPSRRTLLWLLVCAGPPVLINAVLEAQATTVESALARLLGLAAWIGISAIIWTLRPKPASLAAAGAVVLLTAQVDLVLFLPSSAPLALVLLGIALGQPGRAPAGRQIAAVAAVGVCAFALPFAVQLIAFERSLVRAYDAAQPVAAAREFLTDPTPAELQRFDAAVVAQGRAVLDGLETAQGRFPDDIRVPAAMVRVLAHMADSSSRTDGAGQSERVLEDMAALAAETADRYGTSRGHRLHALALGRLGAAMEDRETLAAAARAWVRAADADPQDPESAAEAALAFDRAGLSREASIWAREALARHEGAALDPAAGLAPSRLEALRQIAGEGPGQP